MSDLMAIALVRRLLLELGKPPSPDDLAPFAGTVPTLQTWLITPHPSLGERSPLDILQADDGEARIRELLATDGVRTRSTAPPAPPANPADAAA